MKNSFVLYCDNLKFRIINDNLEVVTDFSNDGLLNLIDFKNPIPSMKDLEKILSRINDSYPFNKIILSDIAFNSGVLHIENLPLSRAKRDEIVKWKLEDILPYTADSYRIEYTTDSKGRIVFYAIPLTVIDALNGTIENLGVKCWDIYPESYFLNDNLSRLEGSNLFILIRKSYFTAIFTKEKEIVYLKTRKRVEEIGIDEEIALVKKVVSENLSETIDNFLLCGKENIPGFKKIFKGFDFEN